MSSGLVRTGEFLAAVPETVEVRGCRASGLSGPLLSLPFK